MQQWNETGTFCLNLASSIYPSYSMMRKKPQYYIYPLFCDGYSISGDIQGEKPAVKLKAKKDLLCLDTYGFTVTEQYTKGGAFSLNYNCKEAMEDNPYSHLKSDSSIISKIQNACGDSGDNYDTTIDFANGEWTWKNSSGEPINNGVYSESEKHPGLIQMKMKEHSLKCDVDYMLFSTYFYIADDGKIYYPAFVKAE